VPLIQELNRLIPTPVKANALEKDPKKHVNFAKYSSTLLVICVSIISCIFLKKFGLNPIATILFWQFLSGNVFRPSSIQLNSSRWIRALGIRANGGDPKFLIADQQLQKLFCFGLRT